MHPGLFTYLLTYILQCGCLVLNSVGAIICTCYYMATNVAENLNHDTLQAIP